MRTAIKAILIVNYLVAVLMFLGFYNISTSLPPSISVELGTPGYVRNMLFALGLLLVLLLAVTVLSHYTLWLDEKSQEQNSDSSADAYRRVA